MRRASAAAPPSPGLCAALALLAGAGAGLAAVLGGPWLVLPVALLALGALALRRRTGALWEARLPAVVALVMFSSQLIAIGRGPANPLSLCIVLLLAFTVLDRLAHPMLPVRSPGFVGWIGLFTGALLFSAVGKFPGDMFSGIAATLPKLLLAVLLVQVLDDGPKARRAVSAFLAAAAFAAGIGLLQVALSHWGFDWSLVQGDYRYANTPLGRTLRASGFARFPNQFAPPLSVAAVLATYLCGSAAGRGRRWALGLAAAGALLAVVFSIARGSWVAAALGLLVLPFVARPRRAVRWLALEGAAVVALLGSGALHWSATHLVGMGEQSVSDRGILVRAGVEALAQHPWSGVGIYGFPDVSPTPEHYPVHNAFLQVASELGWPGLLIFVGVFLWVLTRLARARGRTPDAAAKAQLGALLAGFVPLLVVLQAEPMAYSQFAWIYLALGEACAAAVLRSPELAGRAETRAIHDYAALLWRRKGLAGAGALAVFAAGLGWSLRQPPIFEAVTQFYLTKPLPLVGMYSGDTPLLGSLRIVVIPFAGLFDFPYQAPLESRALQLRVAERVPGKPVEELARDVKVDSTHMHQLVVRVRDRDPEVAAAVANAYPPSFDDFLRQVANPFEQRSLRSAQIALERSRAALESARGELQAFLESGSAADTRQAINASSAQHSNVERQLQRSTAALRAAEGRIAAADERLRGRSAAGPAGREQARAERGAREILAQIARAQAQQPQLASAQSAAEAARLQLDPQRLEPRQARLEVELEQLVDHSQQRFGHRRDPLDEVLRRRLVKAYVDRTVFAEQVKARGRVLALIERGARDLPARRMREDGLRAEVKRLQGMVSKAARSHAEALAQLADRPSEMVIVRPARAASRPELPLPKLDGALCALLGLLAGGVLALLGDGWAQLRRARRGAAR